MGIRELNLTKEQHDWLNGWLELWGAWVYSGRLEKRMSSVIAKFMESVEPGRVMTRPMCNDDDGMLISQVVDSVMYIDKKAFGILLSYYAHGSSRHAIASYYHRVARPRKMLWTMQMLQDLQWDGCRKETDYYEKSYGSRRNSNFRDTQVDIKVNSWSFEAGLRTCQNNSSSIRYGGKGISFIRKNGHILRGGEHICRQRVYS